MDHIAFTAMHQDHPISVNLRLTYPEGTTAEQMSDMMLQLMFRVLRIFEEKHG